MKNKQEVLTELKEAYNECNSLFDAAYTLNQCTFTRTEFVRKVAHTMSEVAQTIGYVIGELESDGVWLTKEEYDSLLEYKYMYEDLCD